jgi:hypothetical protein
MHALEELNWKGRNLWKYWPARRIFRRKGVLIEVINTKFCLTIWYVPKNYICLLIRNGGSTRLWYCALWRALAHLPHAAKPSLSWSCVYAYQLCPVYFPNIFVMSILPTHSDYGPVWFPATVCQAKFWQPQVIWLVFGFCHTCSLLHFINYMAHLS